MKLFRLAILVAMMLAVCTVQAHAVVVIDAGHGGADGGAISSNGTTESPLNLAIAQKVEGILNFLGQETLMTRATEDIDYPNSCTTIRQKKVHDTKARTALINETPDAVVISIHQNSLPGYPKTHGAMVFYNREEESCEIAERVQQALNATVNAGNEKTVKVIGKDVYIMNHIIHPAILVECGFLSNVEETAKLQTQDYQLTLAAAISSGFLQKGETP